MINLAYGTLTITNVQEGSQIWTTTTAPKTPNYTFTISNLTGDSETSVKTGDIIMYSYYRYTVLSVSADGTTVLAGNRVSIRGGTGASAVTYSLIVSNLAIVKDKNGDISPTSITLTAKSQTGSSAMADYAGRFKIETTTDNSTWTTQYISSANESTKTWNVIDDIIAIRCSLYLKDGTTTLLDQQTIPIISDGIDGTNGTNGKDAYTVILTNENHTFAGNTTSAIASEIECNVIAYKGTTQIAATIGTITGQPTGMTTSLLNNGTVNAAFKVTVTTSMVTKNGVLNIPITVDGKTFTKKFTYSLVIKGTSGTNENLLMDVYASSLTKVDAPSSRYLSDASNSTITGEFIAEDNLPDPNATHFYRITDSSASTHGRGLCFYGSGTPPFITGHTYRIGCWVRKHAGNPKMNITLGSYGSWMPTQRIIDNTDWEWFEVVHTFGETDASKTTQSDTYKRLYFYFYNNNVAGSSLDMCGFRMEEIQTNAGTARNLLLNTEKLTNWGVTNGATISDGIVTFPTVTANSWREIYPAKNFKYDLIKNQYAIFSIKVKGNIGEKCCINLGIGVDTTETAYIRKKYLNQYVYFVGTGEWQTICSALPIFDYMFTSGSGTVDFDNCWVTVRIGAVDNYWNGFQAKEPQLCLGTTVTSWSRAPEDIDEAIDNIQVGGRNLVWNSNFHSPVEETWNNWGSPTKREIVTIDGENWMHLITTTASYQGYQQGANKRNGNGEIHAGEKIVFSYDAYAAVDGQKGCIGIQWSNGNNTVSQSWASFELTTVKKRYVTKVFTVPNNVVRFNIMIGQSSTTSPQELWITNIKGEKGNKATDWTPAPEDVDADIEDARKVATNYLAVDNTGIMVADMQDGEQTPSTATGKNVFIDNNSVDIRNGTKVLAQFAEDQITINTTSLLNNILEEQSVYIKPSGMKVQDENFIFNIGSPESTGYFYKKSLSFSDDIKDNEAYSTALGQGNGTTFQNQMVIGKYAKYSPSIDWHGTVTSENPIVTINISNLLEVFTFNEIIVYQKLPGSIFPKALINREKISQNGNNILIDFSKENDGSSTTEEDEYGNPIVIIDPQEQWTEEVYLTIYGNADKAFVIGNGLSENSRSNAFTVDWSGHAEMGDINGYGLQLKENSQSTIDDYINCIDVNNNTIFKVTKNGEIQLSLFPTTYTIDHDLNVAITALGWEDEVIL